MIHAETPISIPFHDIDIMDIAWHGHYLKYFELARTDIMKMMSLDWTDLREMGIALPVVDVQVKYRRPLLYGKSYTVRSKIEEIDYPELCLSYQVFDDEFGKLHCSGSTRQIYMEIDSQTTFFQVPKEIYERLEWHANH